MKLMMFSVILFRDFHNDQAVFYYDDVVNIDTFHLNM